MGQTQALPLDNLTARVGCGADLDAERLNQRFVPAEDTCDILQVQRLCYPVETASKAIGRLTGPVLPLSGSHCGSPS
jgi:hypothetical protein